MDISTDKNARRAQRRPTIHQVVFAGKSGVCDTLEGPVRFNRGDAIVRGTANETWPINRHRFLHLYEPAGETVLEHNGAYRRRTLTVWVLQMEGDFTVTSQPSQSLLHGAAGDWLVQHGIGDHACVREDLFADLYELLH